MIFKWLNVTALALVLASGFYIASKEFKSIPLPFRCGGVTEFNLGDNGDAVRFIVNQDLRLERNARSVFLVKGAVFHGKEKYNLNRAFELSELKTIDKDTVALKIDKVVASGIDNTPDSLFNLYLDEVVLDPESLQLDVVYLEKKAWLISNPMQFFFTCARY